MIGLRNFTAACALALIGAIAAPARAETAGEPYQIDIILPTTGSAGFLGAAEQQVLQIEEQVFNRGNGVHGHPVHFAFHDDQSSPQLAVQILNQIIPTKPKVVLGSALVAMCNAMGPLVRNGPVLYCLSPGIHPPAGSYLFTGSASTQDLFRVTLRYYRLRGWTRIAVLTSTDASGQDAERGIREEFAVPENKELQLVASARFNPTDVSADAQIQHMKAADPQAIITWTSGTPLGTVLRAIAGAGWDVPVAISNSNMLYTQMAQYTGFTPKQLYIASVAFLPSPDQASLPPAMQEAQKQMFNALSAAGKRPDNAAALVWDPPLITVSALDHLAPDATAADLRDYLLHLKGFAGATGIYDMTAFPQRGISVQSVVMTQWDAAAGTWKVVSHPTGTPF